MNRKLKVFTAFMLVFAAILLHLTTLSTNLNDFQLCFAETNYNFAKSKTTTAATTTTAAPTKTTKTTTADNKEATKTVYLTFDDGPSDKVTPKILDVLDEENVKATFFIIGQQAETRKYLIRREYASGHTVAVHSYTHNYRQIYSSTRSLIEDIDKCNNLIRSVTGSYSYVYRFPGGSYGLSEELVAAVTEHGLRYIDWNASTRDAEIWNPTPQQLIDSAKSTSSDINNIVLLSHDSTTKTATAEALREIICFYKSKGYAFATF